MTRILAIILILIAASAASAQPLRVRSGEHAEHTRLVVQIPTGTEWKLVGRRGGARLDVALDKVTFDTAGVFDRLFERRLISIRQPAAGEGLELAFGCECVASAFLHRDSMIVIDIAAGEFIPEPDPTSLLKQAQNDAPLEKTTDLPSSDLALPLLHLSRSGFEAQLISRLLQGADREIVDLDLAGVGLRSARDFGPLLSQHDLNENIAVSSVLDDLRKLAPLDVQQIEVEPKCITSAELGFQSWAGQQSFHIQLAQLRSGLYQEFDKLDETRASRLAQLYAFYGFGAEALQVINLLPDSDAQTERVSAIASIVDDMALPSHNPFRGLQKCDSDVALWAIVTERTLAANAQLDTIEQSFVQLPKHLRRALGPSLSEILVRAGHLEASRRVLRAVERIEKGQPAALSLAKAEIAAAEGFGEKAEALLTEVAVADSADAESPLALAKLIEKRWQDRGGVSQQELDLAAAYAVEYRRSEAGPMLERTDALALSLNQNFNDAFAQLETGPDSREWNRTRNQVFQLLSERADDITFLRHTLTIPDIIQKDLTTETALALARRLVALGFALQARQLANRPQDRTHRTERARLRARAALHEGRPRQALLEIEDDETDAAAALRASAFAQAQEFESVAEYLSQAERSGEALRYAWLAGVDQPSSPTNGKIGNFIETSRLLSQTVSRDADRPLADAAGLLEESSKARALIEDMLDSLENGSRE